MEISRLPALAAQMPLIVPDWDNKVRPMMRPMKHSRKNQGITFIELIVSVVILGVTLAGLLNLFGSAKRWIEVSQSRMTMGEVAKSVLDPLQMQIREDQWSVGANCLSAGACSTPPLSVQNKLYNATYAISLNAPIPYVHRVTATITWNETVF
jgi:type II secretory pathway pseudopilin PulG